MISEGEETTVKIVAGTLSSINQAEDNGSMTGQRESEQAQIWEYRQDSRESVVLFFFYCMLFTQYGVILLKI